MNEPEVSKHVTALGPDTLWKLYYRQRQETQAAHKGIKRLRTKLAAVRADVTAIKIHTENIPIAERAMWFAAGVVFFIVAEKIDGAVRWALTQF